MNASFKLIIQSYYLTYLIYAVEKVAFNRLGNKQQTIVLALLSCFSEHLSMLQVRNIYPTQGKHLSKRGSARRYTWKSGIFPSVSSLDGIVSVIININVNIWRTDGRHIDSKMLVSGSVRPFHSYNHNILAMVRAWRKLNVAQYSHCMLDDTWLAKMLWEEI